MTNSFPPGVPRGVRWLAAAMLLGSAVIATPAPAADETVSIAMDEARILRLPERVTTIVVGNPLIADVSLQQGGLMVLTGKGYGTTNLVTLDRNGAELSNQLIQVQAPGNNVVVVYRGVLRESYSCTPQCNRRITLGDSPEFFNPTVAQTVNRNAAASATAAPVGAR